VNINVCGRREEGKTTLAMSLAKKRHAGIVVFDPRGMISGIVVWGPDELQNAIEKKAWKDGPLIYRYDGSSHEEEFASVTEVLFPPRFRVGGFAFIIDEAGYLQTANQSDENLARVVKQHPTFPARDAVTVIQTNHRLAEFHGTSKALMNELYIFQTTHHRDLEALEEHTGEPEMVEIVSRLPRHHCVRYLYGRQPDGVPQYEVWSDPAAWYIPTTGAATGNEEKNVLDTDDVPGVKGSRNLNPEPVGMWDRLKVR
jgi:hypothetical protein